MQRLSLYSSPISDASARVRIALGLKNVDYHLVSISLSAGRKPPTEITDINASGHVPVLVKSDGASTVALTQSRAILEYLEEAYPESAKLLPDDIIGRARIRALTDIIATDIHPLTTHRVGKKIMTGRLTTTKEWNTFWIREGLSRLEAALADTAGTFCFGDTISMADVYLAPQLWTAERTGISISDFPRVHKIYGELMALDAFRAEKHSLEADAALANHEEQ